MIDLASDQQVLAGTIWGEARGKAGGNRGASRMRSPSLRLTENPLS